MDYFIRSKQGSIIKIKGNSIILSDYVGGQSFRGVLTGLTEAFIVDEATKDKLITEDIHSLDLLRPFLLGRNIKPFASSKATNWLILVPKGFTIKRNLPIDHENSVSEPPPRYGNMQYDDAWDWFSQSYPAIANHLLPFKNQATKRTDKGDFWWELRACDYYTEFENPKLCTKNFKLNLASFLMIVEFFVMIQCGLFPKMTSFY